MVGPIDLCSSHFVSGPMKAFMAERCFSKIAQLMKAPPKMSSRLPQTFVWKRDSFISHLISQPQPVNKKKTLLRLTHLTQLSVPIPFCQKETVCVNCAEDNKPSGITLVSPTRADKSFTIKSGNTYYLLFAPVTRDIVNSQEIAQVIVWDFCCRRSAKALVDDRSLIVMLVC